LKEHRWVRAEEGQWVSMAPTEKSSITKKDWYDVPFHCSDCGCKGHVVYRKGEDAGPPDLPEEALNPMTSEIVDARGDCNEQIVDGVHAL
jgi:hypothetical protein